jgi:hypothetical protein
VPHDHPLYVSLYTAPYSNFPGRLGEPFRVSAPRLGDTLSPPPVAKPYRTCLVVSGPARVGLVSVPHLDGHRVFLLLDLPLGEPLLPVLEGEPPDVKVEWFGEGSFSVSWDRKSLRVRTFRVDVPRRVMKELVRRHGQPTKDGLWLFGALLPRSAPASLRISPSNLQLWVSL